MDGGTARIRRLRRQVAEHWRQPQHRNTYYLTANTLLGAATGLVFWILLARILALPPSTIGLGYAVIALGTTVGVVGKGGLDTALIRHVPSAGRRESARLLRDGILIGGLAALVLALGFAAASVVWSGLPRLGPLGWGLVGAIGILLVATWLQDAFFIAESDAKATLQRNTIFSAARLLLPLPLVYLAFPNAIALAWALSLLVAAVVAIAFGRNRPERPERTVPRRLFMRSAMRNITGSAAEFLPGLLLAPIVLAASGADAAGYFGMAWTGAMLLFAVCAAISRSALTVMVRNGTGDQAHAIRRGTRQLIGLVLPAALVGIVFAPQLLWVFGPDYAREGAAVFRILAASTLFVAPAYLYLAVLRAHERPVALIVFPAAMVAALLVITPLLAERWGLVGAGLAWLIANAPFGAYAFVRLRHEAREVMPDAVPHTQRRAPHLD